MQHKEKFHTLADQYMALVYRVALNCVRTPADADDVTQNVMLRLLRADPVFDSAAHARHWFVRVTVNEARRLLTSPWRRRTVSLEELDAVLPSGSPEETLLLGAVMSLPIKYRLPLYLYYYEGYQANEVAELLRERPSTIQTRLARGREKLKHLIKEDGYDG